VEASEAIRRIFWRHRWLLLILIIVPAAAVVALEQHQPVTFAATASVQGQGTIPDASTQVSAIQSRVAAVATNVTVVQQAITSAGLPRDPVQVAKHDISVTPLGSSAVMVLTVTDASRPGAVRLAGSLARAVVTQLNQLGIKDNPELNALNGSILQLTTKRDKLVSELDHATATGASPTSVQVQSLLSQLSATEQQLATENSTSQQILATLSANTGASVVSTPTYATEASRHAAAYAALAALLGLVLALLFAALRETIRPTVAQPAAGARELGVVRLGNAAIRRGRLAAIDQDLAGRLTLAANRAGARTIVLTGPCSRVNVATLAQQLSSRLAAARPAPSVGHGSRLRTPVPARVSGEVEGGHPTPKAAETGPNGVARSRPEPANMAAIPDPWSLQAVVAMPDIRLGDQPPEVALVVVLPEFAPHNALDRAADLSVAAGWPILGVIGLRRRRWYSSRRSSQSGMEEGERGFDGAPGGAGKAMEQING
jgi:hypothetical protein